MKRLILAFVVVAVFSSATSECFAVDRLFARLRARANAPRIPNAKTSPQFPQPVTGYGTNLHRNFQIRKAQQRAAITGIPPRQAGNILWAR